MKDLAMLDVIERYIRGEMLPEERVYFENLRKTNPAVDEAVVEHTIFLHQIAQYGETKEFKARLNDIHNDLLASGEIRETPPVKVVNLWQKYKRTIAVAASIAGITALAISSLVSALTPKVSSKLDLLSARLDNTEHKINQFSTEVNNRIHKDENPEDRFTNSGTGFLVDPKGYIVTNAHLVRNATRVAVQNDLGEFKVHIIHVDPQADLAFLKIDDTAYKASGPLPYGISKTESQLGEDLFTLGYPRPDAIVYNKGYMSSRTGFQGDTLDFQIAIPANHGNSGTPVLNKDGEVVGIVRANQPNAQITAFAIRSKNIFHSIDAIKADSNLIKNDSTLAHVHLPQSSSIKGLDRQQQIARIQNCIYIVKTN
jgi:S1-C subfamily serine protease